MARIRTNVLHWGNKYDGPNTYKAGREGALDDAYWDEDELVDYQRKSKRKKRVRQPGCPENNGKSHVYVWEKVTQRWWGWDNRWHTYDTWKRMCCGCRHVATGRYRYRRY